MKNHTPLPWHVGNHTEYKTIVFCSGVPLATMELSTASNETQKANAALIVRAVNNHERLVEILKDLDRAYRFDDKHGKTEEQRGLALSARKLLSNLEKGLV